MHLTVMLSMACP